MLDAGAALVPPHPAKQKTLEFPGSTSSGSRPGPEFKIEFQSQILPDLHPEFSRTMSSSGSVGLPKNLFPGEERQIKA